MSLWLAPIVSAGQGTAGPGCGGGGVVVLFSKICTQTGRWVSKAGLSRRRVRVLGKLPGGEGGGQNWNWPFMGYRSLP